MQEVRSLYYKLNRRGMASSLSIPSQLQFKFARYTLPSSSVCRRKLKLVHFPTATARSTDSQDSRRPLMAEIPLDKIRRPLSKTRQNDPEKVEDLMESISKIGLQEPIDVLEVDGIYYGFSGCHRFEAHQKLGLSTIRCKIRRGTKETLRHHLR